jgi:hypothetical protein
MSKGQRITGKQVSKETYIKLNDFLLFDQQYRKISSNAKLLYSYLRNKMNFFQKQTEMYNEGLEGTRSYIDKEGNIFCLADNSELMYMINITEPTLIKIKKELESFNLLEQIQIKDRPNQLYILEPIEISEKWTYLEEINIIRNAKKTKNKEKKEKLVNKQTEQPTSKNNKQNCIVQKDKIPKNDKEIEAIEILVESLPKQTGQILKVFTNTYEEMYGLYGAVLRAKKKAESYFFKENIVWIENSNEWDLLTANTLKKCFQRKRLGEIGKKSIIENFEKYVYSSLEKTFYKARQSILQEEVANSLNTD